MLLMALTGRAMKKTSDHVRGTAAWLVKQAQTLRRAASSRAELRALAAMDAAGLADIGLRRSDVVAALDGGLFSNASTALSALDADRKILVGLHSRAGNALAEDLCNGGIAPDTDAKNAKPSSLSFQIAIRSGRECIA